MTDATTTPKGLLTHSVANTMRQLSPLYSQGKEAPSHTLKPRVRRFCSERVGQFCVEAVGYLVNELMHEGVIYLVDDALNELLH